jgi:hypothetical protein
VPPRQRTTGGGRRVRQAVSGSPRCLHRWSGGLSNQPHQRLRPARAKGESVIDQGVSDRARSEFSRAQSKSARAQKDSARAQKESARAKKKYAMDQSVSARNRKVYDRARKVRLPRLSFHKVSKPHILYIVPLALCASYP